MHSRTRELGQYTTPVDVVDFMISLITQPKSSRILEPAAGTGVFVDRLKQHGFVNIDAYEIDPELASTRADVRVANFLALEIENQYDVVIGNPPYVHWKHLDKNLKHFLMASPYWKNRFNRLSDLSFAFIHAGVRALREGGELIFITPLFWQSAHYGAWLRQYLLEEGYLDLLVDLGEMRIFPNATQHFIIFRYRKSSSDLVHCSDEVPHQVLVCKFREKPPSFATTSSQISELISKLKQENHESKKNNSTIQVLEPIMVYFSPHPKTTHPWRFLTANQVEFTSMLERACIVRASGNASQVPGGYARLEEIATIANGLVSGLDKAFCLSDDELHDLNEFERQHLLTVVKARDVERYRPLRYRHYIFVNDLHDEAEFRSKAPHFYEHLLPFKTRLLARYSYGKELPWWHWAFLRSFRVFTCPVPKIFVPIKERVNHRQHVRFVFIPPDIYPTQDMTAIILKPDLKEDERFILAQLNSDLWFQWFQAKGHIRGGVLEFSEKPLARIPIRLINWQSSKQRRIHEEIVTLVSEMIERGFSPSKHAQVNELLLKLLDLPRKRINRSLK